MEFNLTKQTKFILVSALVVALLGGVSYGGYRYWQGKCAPSSEPTKSETGPLPAPISQTLRKSRDIISKITADEPREVAVMEDQSLNFYSLEGKLIRSIPLKYGEHLLPHSLNPSPNGEYIAFLGGAKTLKEYDPAGGGGVPGRDIFIYERSTNRVSRLTECPSDFSDKDNWYKQDMCYGSFQWGPDSDTFVYVYSSAEKSKTRIGVGKISTGKLTDIYFSSEGQGFPPEINLSPGGQKLFVRDKNFEGIVLIDIEGHILRKYTYRDFKITDIEPSHFFNLYWGSTDNLAYLRISPKQESGVSPLHPTYFVYALDPKEPQKLRRMTPEKEGRTFSNILSVDRRSNRIAQEHFNPEDEQEHADIAVLDWNGDLISDSVKNLLAGSLGREVRIPYSPCVMLYKDYILTHTTEGLVLVNLKEKTAVEIEGGRPWYTPGILIP